MTIIKIEPQENGAHSNSTIYYASTGYPVREGWCYVPDEMLPLENFPFGDVEAEEINGVMTLKRWVAGNVPQPEPHNEEPTELDDINAMLVDHELRIMDLELGITEE